MARTRCPQCNTVSPLPDVHLGKKVRCKKCTNIFVAQADASSAASVVSGGGSPNVSVVAKQSTSTEAATVPTVIAKPVNASQSSSLRPVLAWLAVVLAFTLPVSGASWFVLRNWSASPGGSSGTNEEAFGVIEIASKSVKFNVFKLIVDTDGEEDIEVVSKGNSETALAKGMNKSRQFDRNGLADTRKFARSYASQLRGKHALPDSRIHVVVSDGLFSPIAGDKKLDEQTREQAIRALRAELIDAIREATGKELAFVNVEAEASYQIKGIIPKKYWEKAVFFDIGGTSTKGGYLNGGVVRNMSVPGVPGGSVFKSKVAEKRKALGGEKTFAEVSSELAETELRKPIRDEAEKNVGIRTLNRVYLAGGIVWVVANVMHPARREAKLSLTADDLRQFAAKVRESPTFVAKFKPPAGMPAAALAELETDLINIQQRFKDQETLIAYSEVLLALADELDFKSKELTFYRHSDFAWTLAYVIETVNKNR